MNLTLMLASCMVIASLTACGGADTGASQTSTVPTTSSHIAAIPLPAASSQSALPPSASPGVQALLVARAQWQAGGVTNYTFSYKEGGGYKFAQYPYKIIQVTAGKVASVDGDAAAAQEPVYQRLTVEALFDAIQKAYLDAATPAGAEHHVGVTYDAILGFPSNINTALAACCDQDHELEIINFQITL